MSILVLTLSFTLAILKLPVFEAPSNIWRLSSQEAQRAMTYEDHIYKVSVLEITIQKCLHVYVKATRVFLLCIAEEEMWVSLPESVNWSISLCLLICEEGTSKGIWTIRVSSSAMGPKPFSKGHGRGDVFLLQEGSSTMPFVSIGKFSRRLFLELGVPVAPS